VTGGFPVLPAVSGDGEDPPPGAETGIAGQKVQVLLVDDLDGSEATETVTFLL
jgi:hypothetical protein